MPNLITPEPVRFYRHFMPEPMSGCWLWTAAVNNKGYGVFGVGSRADGSRGLVLAHRWSYERHVGCAGNFEVTHKCDVPSCVNPGHLKLGTHTDNMADKTRKGRDARGSRHGQVKLTEAAALEISRSPLPRRVLATKFGVSTATIGHVQRGEGWLHVTKPATGM